MKYPPPPSGKIKSVGYPSVHEQSLDNGMQVLTIEDDRFPIVSVQLAFPVGRVHNPDDNWSLIQLATETLKEGTKRRTSRQIADELDYRAVHYSNDVLMESTLHSVTVLEDRLEQALELLTEMLFEPVFPDGELQKVRARWCSMLAAQRSHPEFLALERIYEALYESHPYAKNFMRLDHIRRAGRERVKTAYQDHYSPAGAMALFAGPVSPARSLELASRFWGGWTAVAPADVHYPDRPESPGPRVHIVDRPGSVQVRLLVGIRSLPADDGNFIRLRLMNQVLGGGASSRLFLKLREEKGYTYGAYSRVKGYRRDGLLTAGAGVRSNVTREALDEVLFEMDRMRQTHASEEEMTRSRSEMLGALIRQLETPVSVGSLELKRRLNGLPPDYYRDLPSVVEATSTEAIKELAERLLSPENMVIVVVGDRKDLEPRLRGLGDAAVFDVDGNRLE